MRFSMNMRLGRLAATAACAALAVMALKVRGQPAPAEPATPAKGADAFVAPLFTDDFESGDLKKGGWELRIGGAGAAAGGRGTRGAGGAGAAGDPATPPAAAAGGPTITVEKDVVAHGKNAVLVHYPANSKAYAFLVAKNLPDSLKSHFFGRAYVQFPKAPPNAHDVFITVGNAGFPTSNFLELGLRQNKAQLSYQQNAAGVTRGETMIAGPAYPVGKWFCLEWEFNDSPDNITVWIDGTKVNDNKVAFQGKNTDLVKGFSEFALGFRSWGNVPAAFDVYYDDIAYGTGRIGPIK